MSAFDITTAESSDSVCYVLLPEGSVSDMVKWAEKASSRFNTNIVLISGMDWNRDMSPWSAAGVMKEKKNFSGGAGMYLKELTEDLIPNVEQWLKLKDPKRYLLGISLSGLFTIWSLSRYNGFIGVGSISGSLWFDGFVEWAHKTPFFGNARIYLSLGIKEKNAPDRRMANVEDATRETAGLLEGKGFDVTFEMVPGTHFSPAAPKFDRALEMLLQSGQENSAAEL